MLHRAHHQAIPTKGYRIRPMIIRNEQRLCPFGSQARIRTDLLDSSITSPRPTPPLRSIWLGSHSDTIYAPATPNGKSAIAIVRIDGPDSTRVIQQFIRPTTTPINPKQTSITPTQNTPQHHQEEHQEQHSSSFHNHHPPPLSLGSSGVARVCRLVCPHSQQIIDPEAVILRFDHHHHRRTSSTDHHHLLLLPNSSSSTVELHLHGSPAIVRALLHSLSRFDSLRPAEPGEFTRRRFDRNQNITLNQIVSLKHLIDAETEEQRKWAIRGFESQHSQIYQDIRQQIIQIMSLCEAIIDFSEDGSIDDRLVWHQVKQLVCELQGTISVHITTSERCEKVSDGIRISLFGEPNAGKSTLLNWLVNRQAAIVSPYPGTTRDVLDISMDYHGFPIIISDMAGFRTTTDPIETIGIERAHDNLQRADLRIYLKSITEIHTAQPNWATLSDGISPTMILLTKTDLTDQPLIDETLDCYRCYESTSKIPVYPISVVSETGLEHFTTDLVDHLKTQYSTEKSGTDVIFATAYQKDGLRRISQYLQSFLDCLETNEVDVVIAIEELRLASGILGKLTASEKGEVEPEEILGKIFQTFCIGK